MHDDCIYLTSALNIFVEDIPAYVFWKDIYSRYLGCNTRYAITVGLHRPSDIIGKTDEYFYPHDLVIKYQSDDNLVITTGKPLKNIIERIVAPVFESAKTYVAYVETTKMPLCDPDSKKIVGVIGIYSPTEEYAEKYNQYVIDKLEKCLQKSQSITSCASLSC